MDWNSLLSPDPHLLFSRYSKRYFPHADDLVRYLTDFAEAFKLDIAYDTRVERIRRDEDGFTVTDQHGHEHRARRLVMATGLTRPNTPTFPVSRPPRSTPRSPWTPRSSPIGGS